MPIRIQRKRTKGWKSPENTVYVGRPGKWGNPYKIDPSEGMTRERAMEAFTDCVVHRHSGPWGTYPSNEEIQQKLRDKNLSCFCHLDQPCHADILLEIANS